MIRYSHFTMAAMETLLWFIVTSWISATATPTGHRSATTPYKDTVRENPFERKINTNSSSEEIDVRFRQEIKETLKKLTLLCEPNCGDDPDRVSVKLAERWKKNEKDSQIAFRGLLLILERCLSSELKSHTHFTNFVESLGDQATQFWEKTIGLLYDSDMKYGTNYRDALLFSLMVYDVNTGKNGLRNLFIAVPGFRGALMAKKAKRLDDAFSAMMLRRKYIAAQLDNSTSPLPLENIEGQPSPPPSPSDIVLSAGLANGNSQGRVIAVSNAPPASLHKRNDSWGIGEGSGGLVSGCAPVMNKDPRNMWLACLGPKVPLNAANTDGRSVSPATNSLGIPITTTTSTEVRFGLLQDPNKKQAEDTLSLLHTLKTFNKGKYKLSPVVVSEEDYETYYGGISNGLLWPVLHGLPEHILNDYNNPNVLREHWEVYVRVNYQFAINAARNSKPQDFLWIHDYHLMLTGTMLQALNPNLETGFFLHIPFQPPETFFTKYSVVGKAVLRGVLAFSKVGFQTEIDRSTFIKLAREHLRSIVVEYDYETDKHHVTYDGFTASLGVFPVSIENKELLKIAGHNRTIERAKEIRRDIMGKRDGKLFFAVERFDYTKGIKEKLEAYQRFFERYPDRICKDVFFQVAVINRRSVETYRYYQDECVALANQINRQFKCANDKEWRPLIFETESMARADLIPHYMAMDVGVVTPRKDGMNLVAKEMLVCNPSAALMLSTGAGTEQQFSSEGFYKENQKLYYRVSNIYNVNEFADVFHKAAIDDPKSMSAKSGRLAEFLLRNDIEKWSRDFLDPGWTRDVIRVHQLRTIHNFHGLMIQARDVRRHIVQNILKGIPLRPQFAVSLRNALTTLKNTANRGGNVMWLRTMEENGEQVPMAKLDISDEIGQLEIDLRFLNHVQSKRYDDLERFIGSLSAYHPDGLNAFNNEISAVIKLIGNGDHFRYFFTDRDGTLKSYSCSYQRSMQGAYRGVILATFAQRCAEFASVVTTAPLSGIGILDVIVAPDGYYSFGTSSGREWYIHAGRQFKDESISKEDLGLLDKLAEKIRTLLREPKYQLFSQVGSGFQKHYDQIIVAHQDCYGSIDQKKSMEWANAIQHIVKALDPTSQTLYIHNMKTDIKISLKSESSGGVFTKGDGIRLWAQRMGLNLADGKMLIFGDSEGDVPMLKEALRVNARNTYAVWVTTDEKLRQQVARLCRNVNNGNYAFVSSPEVVLGAMAQATVRRIKIRQLQK